MKPIPFFACSLLLAFLFSGPVLLAEKPAAKPAEAPLPETISFNRDIRPIMSDTCFHCHGFDPNTREQGLRLDIREEALKATKNDLIPIVPGKPDESEIIFRIFDDEDPMPPEKAHKPLTSRQKALFRKWVEQGAEYEDHWSYTPLEIPDIPERPKEEKKGGNQIDAFIKAKLAEKKLTLSAAAPKARLLRRLSLDLIGLPPTPSETAAFVMDRDPGAYERQVDRLLASPHFGERMAVWWLDIARFADTVGFHGDQNQRIFPYRDYIIKAFNENKPFDEFTIEQLAGDLLPNPTVDQRVATGYNRLNMMTREGGAQPAEYLAKYGAERVRSVAAAWFGSTFGCAECHDHKFDPIQSSDFYEMQAFFADVRQWGVYANYGYTPEPELKGVNNESPFPPEIKVVSPYYKKGLKQSEKKLAEQFATARKHLAGDEKQQAAFTTWAKATAEFLVEHPDGWFSPASNQFTKVEVKKKEDVLEQRRRIIEPDGKVRTDRGFGKEESLEVSLHPCDLPSVAAIRIAFAYSDESSRKNAAGRTVNLKVFVEDAEGKRRAIGTKVSDADILQPTYRGGKEIFGLGNSWRMPYFNVPETAQGIWLLDLPVALKAEEQIVLSFTGNNTHPMQLAFTPLGAVNALDVAPANVIDAFGPEDKRTIAQENLLRDAWLLGMAGNRPVFDAARKIGAEIREWDGGQVWSMVTESVEKPLEVRVLPRGNFLDKSGLVVLPATPSFLPGRLESTEEKRLTRLDLAKWIVSEQNPITARAVVNRLWQPFFGTGLSAVLDDLGSQGELPSHPELLDWMASEFRRSGWDVKHVVKLMVTSETYRQNSSLRSELKDLDPGNRWLASQNPRRLDAEFVRDNALFAAGLLNLDDIGGPSAKPYQPAGYYASLQFPGRRYTANTDERQFRRGLYTHWQRTFLHPMMASFDAPNRDECAAIRTASNTPQQALTLLNDPTFVEAARLLAKRVLDGDSATDADRLGHLFQLVLARDPKAKEAKGLTAFLGKQREHYGANKPDAVKLSQVGISPQAEDVEVVVETAAWTQVCRVLLNAHESITRY